MTKKQIWLIFGIIIVVLLVVGTQTGLFSTSGATLTRTGPSTVSPGQDFTIEYNPLGTLSGNWFVAWEDSVSGGCTPSNYKAFLANGGKGSKSFKAPSSGSCTFSGYYQFTGESKKYFSSKTVVVTTDITCSTDDKKCEGKYYYTCKDYKWWLEGKVVGKCGVVCIKGSDCKSGEECKNNKCVAGAQPPQCDYGKCYNIGETKCEESKKYECMNMDWADYGCWGYTGFPCGEVSCSDIGGHSACTEQERGDSACKENAVYKCEYGSYAGQDLYCWKLMFDCPSGQFCKNGQCVAEDCHGSKALGSMSYCTSSCKCNAGEGDCDGDSQCNLGLVCVKNSGEKYGFSSTTDVCEEEGGNGNCNTDADTNCDGIVSFDELIVYANKWVAGQVNFDKLINVANAWAE